MRVVHVLAGIGLYLSNELRDCDFGWDVDKQMSVVVISADASGVAT